MILTYHFQEVKRMETGSCFFIFEEIEGQDFLNLDVIHGHNQ